MPDFFILAFTSRLPLATTAAAIHQSIFHLNPRLWVGHMTIPFRYCVRAERLHQYHCLRLHIRTSPNGLMDELVVLGLVKRVQCNVLSIPANCLHVFLRLFKVDRHDLLALAGEGQFLDDILRAG